MTTIYLLLKEKLIFAPDWEYNFVLMCDTSDYVAGAVLGQRKDKKIQVKF